LIILFPAKAGEAVLIGAISGKLSARQKNLY